MSDIAQLLKRSRVLHALTQHEVATKVGVSQGTISNWELGITKPEGVAKKKLQDLLGNFAGASNSDGVEIAAGSPGAFGAWLSRMRANSGLSVPELAKKSDVSAVSIYNIESGKSLNPQSETRSRLEKALKAKVPTEVKEEAAEEQDAGTFGALTDFDPYNDEQLPKTAGVYVLYDVSERPVYVGKSDNIAKRVKAHADKFWFRPPIVSNAAYLKVDNSKMRHSIEQVLIKFLKSNAVINKQSVDR